MCACVCRQESLYADLQMRFGALKHEWEQAEGERQSMRKALKSAQASVQRYALHHVQCVCLSLHAMLFGRTRWREYACAV